MTHLIKYRMDGERRQERQYKTEKRFLNKLKQLKRDPRLVELRIFKEVTYGEQESIFFEEKLPF